MLNHIFDSIDSESGNFHSRGLSGFFLAFLSCVVLAFNAAGALHTGFLGLLGLIFIFLLLGLIGCYWYVASVHLLAQWKVTKQRPSHQKSQAWLVSLQGLWPIALLGPAVAAQRWWPSFGLLFTLSILVGTGFTLILAIRQAYNASWIQASFCFGTTIMLGVLAILGLLGWPMMLLLGAKNFGPALIVLF